MRFIQFADAHLNSGDMKGDLRSSFARACALAVDRKADFVLIPGDLFDYEAADYETISFVTSTLANIAPIPVFIAPGNHDSLLPRSPYKDDNWPANIHIFKAPKFETVVLESLDCSITGIAHVHKGVMDRLVALNIPHPMSKHSILLFHGSRESSRPSGKEAVIPFTDTELIGQGFTYAAIGHYHSFCDIADSTGTRAAYSGCMQGRGLDETGEKCVLAGEIDASGRVGLERVEVAERRILKVEVNVTGLGNQSDVFAKVDNCVNHARQQDVVHVFLRGILPLGLEIDVSAWESHQSFHSSSLNVSGVEPDYDLEAISRDSAASPLRSAFVRKMIERQAAATTDDERRTLQDAIYYGLHALDGRALEARDAD